MTLLPLLNWLLEKGVIALLIFTPLAFGTVQQWSVSLMELSAFLLLLVFLLKSTCDGYPGSAAGGTPDYQSNAAGGFKPFRHGILTIAAILLLLFITVVLLQLLPLPLPLLRLLSPQALQLYETFGAPAATLHSISINHFATRQELLLLLTYLSLFIVIIGHYRTKRQLRSLVQAIFALGCFLVLFALVQKATWNGRIFWFYPLEESLRAGSGIWGPFINRNHFAGYLEMVIPLGLGLLLYTAPGRKSSAQAQQGNSLARFLASPTFATFTFYFILVLLMTATLFATLSRGGIVACVVSFAFFVWLTRTRRSLKNRSLLISLLALTISAVVVFAAWDRIEGRFDDGGYIDRATVWRDSLGIVREYPLFGSGLGAFESTYLRYQSAGSGILFDHAHNDYIELLTDTGLVGSLLFGGAVLLLFVALYRRWRITRSTYSQCIGAAGLSASLAMALHSGTDFNLHIPANALLLTVVVAITYCAVFNLSDTHGTGSTDPVAPDPLVPAWHGSPVTITLTRSVIILLGLLLLSFPAASLVADSHFSQVARLLDDPATDYLDRKPLTLATLPDYLAAATAARQAYDREPGRALYAATLAEQYARLGRWATALATPETPLPATVPGRDHSFRQAEQFLHTAIMREPTNPDYHLALADIYESYRKEPVKADAELTLAARAFPINGAVQNAVAMHYLLAGRMDKALTQARHLAKIDDSYILRESPQKADILAQMPRYYRDTIYRSYLFNALEIAWRASRDPRIVKSLVPDAPLEAALVFVTFMESKGVELPE
jgi:O-antigen ligase